MKFKIMVLLFCMTSGLNAAIPADCEMLPFYQERIKTFMSFVNRIAPPDSRQEFLEMINYPESEPRTLEEYASRAYSRESYKVRDILKKSYGIPEKSLMMITLINSSMSTRRDFICFQRGQGLSPLPGHPADATVCLIPF